MPARCWRRRPLPWRRLPPRCRESSRRDPFWKAMSQFQLEVIRMSSFTLLGLKPFRLTAAFCCLGVLSMQSRAAEFQARWSELAPLLEGRELSIPLPGGAVVTGELLNVRADSLNLDIRKVSGRTEYRKGPASIPRASVVAIRASQSNG